MAMKEKAQAWLCILNRENFEIVKEKRVYGIPKNTRAINSMKTFKRGDVLLFYAISPTKRILGISEVASSMYEESKPSLWRDRSYPYRVRISHVNEIAVPLKDFIGKIGSVKNRIPMGMSIIPISEKDLETIRKLVHDHAKD